MRSVASVCVVILAFYSVTVMGNGKLTPGNDICVRKIGVDMVRLSAYQPQNNIFGDSCEEIPAAGETHLVINLLDQAMRNMPISLKIFHGNV